MTLKLTLKPGESVFIGTTRLLVVSRSTCVVIVDGDAPVMRAAQRVDESEATEPLPRFRYLLQEMYMRNDRMGLIQEYFAAATALLCVMPEALPWVSRANELLLTGSLWDAVRIGRDLAKHISPEVVPVPQAAGQGHALVADEAAETIARPVSARQ